MRLSPLNMVPLPTLGTQHFNKSRFLVSKRSICLSCSPIRYSTELWTWILRHWYCAAFNCLDSEMFRLHSYAADISWILQIVHHWCRSSSINRPYVSNSSRTHLQLGGRNYLASEWQNTRFNMSRRLMWMHQYKHIETLSVRMPGKR